jgi:hypothetical protein
MRGVPEGSGVHLGVLVGHFESCKFFLFFFFGIGDGTFLWAPLNAGTSNSMGQIKKKKKERKCTFELFVVVGTLVLEEPSEILAI